jgi:PilZ domain
MNDSTLRRSRNQRLFDGRIEKRVPSSLPIYLASLEEPRARERTLTENVSPHGARVISQRSWQSSENSLITTLTGKFPQIGRVIYCSPNAEDRFSVGVEFSNRRVKWEEHSRE